jgi:hypothetical protein
MRKVIATLLIGKLTDKKQINVKTKEIEFAYLPSDEKKYLYEVFNPKINTRKLIQGQNYLIEYRFRNKVVTEFGMYLDSTPEFRTLVFTHPTIDHQTIGIPLMNIINLMEVAD